MINRINRVLSTSSVLTITRSRAAIRVMGLVVGLTAGACADDPASDAEGTEGASETGVSTAGETAVADDTGSSGASTTSGEGATGSSSSDGADSTDTGEVGGVACIDEQFVSGLSPGPNYSELGVTLGSHCQGTNHQDITEIERVVFLGDSVTVGTRPSTAPDFYRTRVAAELAVMFDLEPPAPQWEQVNVFDGTAGVQESGDFAACAEWGARNDDLMSQLESCFAVEDFTQRTLVVMTMGGNDASSIAQDAVAGVPVPELFVQLEEMVANHEQAIDWLVGDPDKFPNGVFVVNANVYEFTDYTMDLLSCPAAGTAGFSNNPKNPEVLLGSLRLINEEYARIAQESGTDVVFMFENFCGHGFHANDPASPCYRGPDNATWFDFTCIHPNPTGHQALADLFVNVIAE